MARLGRSQPFKPNLGRFFPLFASTTASGSMSATLGAHTFAGSATASTSASMAVTLGAHTFAGSASGSTTIYDLTDTVNVAGVYVQIEGQCSLGTLGGLTCWFNGSNVACHFKSLTGPGAGTLEAEVYQAALAPGLPVRLIIDGVNASGPTVIPTSGGWQWVTMGTGLDTASAHDYVIRFGEKSGNAAIRRLRITNFTLKTTALAVRPILAGYGDSIVAGDAYGTPGDATTSWFDLAANSLGYQAINKGVGSSAVVGYGDTPSRIADITGISPAPAAVVIVYGTNDVGVSSTATFGAAYLDMIQKIKQAMQPNLIICERLLKTAIGDTTRDPYSTQISTGVTSLGTSTVTYDQSMYNNYDGSDGTHPAPAHSPAIASALVSYINTLTTAPWPYTGNQAVGSTAGGTSISFTLPNAVTAGNVIAVGGITWNGTALTSGQVSVADNKNAGNYNLAKWENNGGVGNLGTGVFWKVATVGGSSFQVTLTSAVSTFLTVMGAEYVPPAGLTVSTDSVNSGNGTGGTATSGTVTPTGNDLVFTALNLPSFPSTVTGGQPNALIANWSGTGGTESASIEYMQAATGAQIPTFLLGSSASYQIVAAALGAGAGASMAVTLGAHTFAGVASGGTTALAVTLAPSVFAGSAVASTKALMTATLAADTFAGLATSPTTGSLTSTLAASTFLSSTAGFVVVSMSATLAPFAFSGSQSAFISFVDPTMVTLVPFP